MSCVLYLTTVVYLFHGVAAFCFNRGALDIQCKSQRSYSKLIVKFGNDKSKVKCGQEASEPQYRAAPIIQFPFADKVGIDNMKSLLLAWTIVE